VDRASSTILVVDDFEAARRITARMLAEGGFTVIEASDGFEALAACARQPVRVVVADVRMPGMTGFELGRRIAADWPHIRMLYVTGYPDEGDTDVGLTHRVMYKPYAADQLLDVVQSLVDRPPGPETSPGTAER
jgi:CheY-like chemotaxis protein